MKKVLCTFGVGPLASVLELTRPAMIEYAERHGYAFVDASAKVEDMDPTIPPSWRKLDVMSEILYTNDAVLWLDADILIVEQKEDIAEDVSLDCRLACAFHDTPVHGYTPNAGLLFCQSPSILGTIKREAEASPFGQKIWEQAGLWEMAGINTRELDRSAKPDRDSMLRYQMEELGHRWNYCFFELRGIPRNLRFVHFAGSNAQSREERIVRFRDSIFKMECLEAWTEERLAPYREQGIL